MVPFAGYEMPVQYASIIEEHRTVRSTAGPVRPVAHGRDRGHRRGGGRVPASRSRQRPGGVGDRPGPVLDGVRRRRRHHRRPHRVPAGDRALLGRLQRLEPRRGHRAADGGLHAARGLRTQLRIARRPDRPRGSAGPERRGARADLTDAGPRRDRQLPVRRWRRCRESRASSRGPATPERTASSCSAPPRRAASSGRRSPAAGSRTAPGRAGSARATRCGSRPGCRSTATSSIVTTNPFEVNLGRVVKLDKGDFVGRAALAAVQQSGPDAQARRPSHARQRDSSHGYAVQPTAQTVGHVTSGTLSPTLGDKIAMALVPGGLAEHRRRRSR